MIEQLIERAKRGDQAAKEEIYEQYKATVRIYANSFFLIGGEKEDLLQEGMIGLFEAVDSYCPEKSGFNTFASLCIRRRILNAVQKANSDKNKPLFQSALLSDEMIDESPDPLAVVIGKDLLGQLRAFIANNLTAAERDVVEYFCSGYSHDEICQKTGRSYKSVDSALQRARKKITEFRQLL